MTTPTLHDSAEVVSALANAEAWRTDSRRIEPVHLLLAMLNIIDGVFEHEAERMGLGREAIAATAAISDRARELIPLGDEEITGLRRRLRRTTRSRRSRRAHRRLSWSLAARRVFQRAAELAGEEEPGLAVDLTHLVRAAGAHRPDDVEFFGRQASPGGGGADGRAAVGGSQATGPVGPWEPDAQPVTGAFGDDAFGTLARDLSALAAAGRLAPVIGRRDEMRALARFLQRTSKPNVLVIGDAGVGKTAVVEGLALKLAESGGAGPLGRMRIVQVQIADLVAGTRYRGDLEERLRDLLARVSGDPDLVLFLDEVHLVMRAGSSQGPMDVANILKPALAGGDFRCIGATTTDEFERYIQGDKAFLRRFQLLRVEEPSQEEALEMCRGWVRRIEEIQQVVFEDEAVEAAVSMSHRLIRGRRLPDKAIDLLENAAVYVKVSSLSFRPAAPVKDLPRIGRREIETVLREQYQLAAGVGGRPIGFGRDDPSGPMGSA